MRWALNHKFWLSVVLILMVGFTGGVLGWFNSMMVYQALGVYIVVGLIAKAVAKRSRKEAPHA